MRKLELEKLIGNFRTLLKSTVVEISICLHGWVDILLTAIKNSLHVHENPRELVGNWRVGGTHAICKTVP